MSSEVPGHAVVLPAHVGGPHAAYEALLENGVLGFQACSACRSAIFPPRLRCSACGADELTWRASAGRGTIYSTTVIAPRGREAYAVVLVDLDEGYRLMSRVEDHAVAIGARVAAELSPRGGSTLPFFVPEGGDR
jgi:uncharacterized OB-fold protein